jgi:hypothetical protein
LLASKARLPAKTPHAMRASLLASAIASTLRCSRFLAAFIQPDDVERVLTDIDANHGNCAVEVLGHGVLLCLRSPLPDSALAGQEHGRTIPLADIGRPEIFVP